MLFFKLRKRLIVISLIEFRDEVVLGREIYILIIFYLGIKGHRISKNIMDGTMLIIIYVWTSSDIQ